MKRQIQMTFVVMANERMIETMAEYIEREALMRNLKQFAYEHLTPLIEILIQKQPVADVVEVVRCNDCKHLMFSDCYGECRLNHIGIVRPDDFCSRGIRKEGDDK